MIFFFSEVFGFTPHVAKSEYLIGFYKIVRVPSKTRDQKKAKKIHKKRKYKPF